MIPDASSDQIPLYPWQAAQYSRAVDDPEAELSMIKSHAVIEGAKTAELLESTYIVQEGNCLRQGQVALIHSQ